MSKETFMKKLILFTFVTLLLASCSRSKNHTNGEEYLYSIKNAIKEDIVEQNCEFKDFDVLITE